MKYFIDTEFIEGFKRPATPLFWSLTQPKHFVDLISIGIVCEDGREYYAISNQFNPEDADVWVKDNVLYPLMRQNGYDKPLSNLHGCLSYNKRAIKSIQKAIGKHPAVIAMEIRDFVMYPKRLNDNKSVTLTINVRPEFYGYYCDYDWVVLCSLFGRMIDLPEGFPMYCNDLKQTLDEKVNYILSIKSGYLTFDEQLEILKTDPRYPKQRNEHNALDDARWNVELYKFLNLKLIKEPCKQ